MTKLKKKDIKKALKELMFEPAPLSTNKGKLLRNDHCPSKYNSKKRRHDGWITPRASPGKYSEMFAEGVEPQLMYEPWQTRKDGIHYDPDNTHIRSEFMSGWSKCRNCRPTCHLYETCEQKDNPNPIQSNNLKLLKQAQIRQAKKDKLKIKIYFSK